MTEKAIKDMAASVRAKLLGLARRTGKPYDEVVIRYALERFLYRLSKSPYKDQFLLKGGLLLMGRGLPQARPTRDIDLLSLIPVDVNKACSVIQAIGEIPLTDGLAYDFSQMAQETLSPESDYPGLRLKFQCRMGKAVVPMQIDIGFGDWVVPNPTEVIFPTLLDMEAPVVLGYAPETVIAEKFEAALDLAELNSRMKDYYDIWFLSETCAFEGRILQEAITATCNRRRTEIRSDAVMFTDDFVERPDKKRQWSAFLGKSPTNPAPKDFPAIIEKIRTFLRPVAQACQAKRRFESTWIAGGPWQDECLK
jgi:hypothetical protein